MAIFTATTTILAGTMKFLIITQPTTGGVGEFVLNLARSLISKGSQVSVACPSDIRFVNELEDIGAQHIPLDLQRQPSFNDFKVGKLLRNIAQDFDVIRMESTKAGLLGRLFIKNQSNLIYSPHGWAFQMHTRLSPIYRLIEWWLAPRCLIQAVSEKEAELSPRNKRSRAPQVIPNGVDTNKYKPAPEKIERFLISCIGRLSTQKGQDLLLEAVAEVRIHEPNIRLEFAGDGPERDALEHFTRILQITDIVTFHGNIDPGPLYQRSDLVVLPSRWEGGALTLLEAMASGAAIIVSNVAGSEYLATAGIISETRKPQLAQAILSTLRDEANLERMRVESRKIAIECFRLDDCMRKHAELLKSLCR